MEKGGRSVPLHLERNSLRVEAHVCCNVRRDPDIADKHVEDVDVEESHASSSAEPAAEPPAEVATEPSTRVENVIKHQRVAFPFA